MQTDKKRVLHFRRCILQLPWDVLWVCSWFVAIIILGRRAADLPFCEPLSRWCCFGTLTNVHGAYMHIPFRVIYLPWKTSSFSWALRGKKNKSSEHKSSPIESERCACEKKEFWVIMSREVSLFSLRRRAQIKPARCVCFYCGCLFKWTK